REAPVRAYAGIHQCAPLVVGREADPEIALLLAHREAREERLADEIAPSAEHRRDPDARPARERLVQTLRGPAAPAAEGGTGLAALPHAAKSPDHSGKPRAFCH